jgi:MFS family permease
MGYMVITSAILVTCGRVSDIYGRTRLYIVGFAIFTLGSFALAATPGHGNAAATYIIAMRILQGLGGAFLFANSAAMLTDVFPVNRRGLALGINQIALVAGSLLGLVLGGLLATIEWRLVFLVSVPFGLLGTIWAYLKLHETTAPQKGERFDPLGNVAFASGLTIFLVALTYGIQPYGDQPTG